MPRKVWKRLTPAAIRKLPPGRHVDGGGLHLIIKPSGARYWVFRFTLDGRVQEVGMGPYQETSVWPRSGHTLREARGEAGLLRGSVEKGQHPGRWTKPIPWETEADRQAKAAKAAQTFRTVALDYIATHEATWRNEKHRAQWRSTLDAYAFPIIGDLHPSAITRDDVLRVLTPIWTAKPETASRLRGRIEAILDAAKARDLRTGENPAAWRGNLKPLLPARAKLSRGHHAALDYRALPAFMAALDALDTTGARALAFTILTAARTSETTGATWREIDLDAGTWTVPASRMKAARPHRVPLSAPALAILATMHGDKPPRRDAPLFPAPHGGALSNAAMAMTLRRMGESATVHGFRSTFRDWAAETTSFPGDLCEAALAHIVSDKTEAAYRRGDLLERRRELMAVWGAFATSTQSGSNVLPLAAARVSRTGLGGKG